MTGHSRDIPLAARFATLIVLLLVASAARAGTTTITLRSVARTAPDATLTVADVARVEGPHAEAITSLALPNNIDTVAPGAIRDTVLATGLIRTDQLAIRGRVCRVVRGVPAETRAAVQAAPQAPEAPERPAGEIVLDRVRAHLAASLRITTQDLRVTFNDRDREHFHTLIAGRRLDVRTTGFSRRMPIALELFEGDRSVWRETLRVSVEVRRDVAVAAGPLGRGELLGADDLRAESRWVPPDDDALPLADALAQRLRSRLAPGEPVRWRNVERPTLVERGDIVMVRSAVGAASVRLRARARGDAYEGDTIEFETIGPRGDRRIVRATVTGPGRAVLASEEIGR